MASVINLQSNQFLLLLQHCGLTKINTSCSSRNRDSLLAQASMLYEYPIRGWEYDDVTVVLLEGLGVVNSKSDWLK